MADAPSGEQYNAYLDPRLSGHLAGKSSRGQSPQTAAYVANARANGHQGSSNCNGSETCLSCGGYLKTLGQVGRQIHKKCRQCDSTIAVPMNNTTADFLGQTVADYN